MYYIALALPFMKIQDLPDTKTSVSVERILGLTKVLLIFSKYDSLKLCTQLIVFLFAKSLLMKLFFKIKFEKINLKTH